MSHQPRSVPPRHSRNTPDIDSVHDVIQHIYNLRQHRRQCQFQHQFADFLRPQTVSCFSFHCNPPILLAKKREKISPIHFLVFAFLYTIPYLFKNQYLLPLFRGFFDWKQNTGRIRSASVDRDIALSVLFHC